MSHERRELRQLKMDMLRVRGQLQREDMLLALQDIRGGGSPDRPPSMLRMMGGLGAGMIARRGWLGVASAALRHPLAATAGLAALRVLKRQPLVAATAMLAGVAAFGLARRARTTAARRHAPGDDVFSAPSG